MTPRRRMTCEVRWIWGVGGGVLPLVHAGKEAPPWWQHGHMHSPAVSIVDGGTMMCAGVGGPEEGPRYPEGEYPGIAGSHSW